MRLARKAFKITVAPNLAAAEPGRLSYITMYIAMPGEAIEFSLAAAKEKFAPN
jgi:hypothetical protein